MITLLTLAILIGMYSYTIFFLGLLGFLYKNIIMFVTILFIFLFLFIERKFFKKIMQRSKSFFRQVSLKTFDKKIILLFSLLLISQACVNLLGALAPELGFDALWYHLTLPKLYLINHSIYHIPGGLLYYSDMPKLGEMLYVGALTFGNEIMAKLVHYSFGIIASLALYIFAKKFFSTIISLAAVVIFYSSLVVAWESTTAYVDLTRTFFEILALLSFINWKQSKNRRWLLLSSIMIGLAITTKLLAFGSLIIFLILIIFPFNKKSFWTSIKNAAYYCLIAIVIPLPWLVFATLHTGNPFYPFFSDVYKITPEPLILVGFFTDIWNIFTRASDPISPLFIIIIPLAFVTFSSMRKEIKVVTIYSILAIIIWYFTPRTGGGRFILPYLPAFSLVYAGVLDMLLKNKTKYNQLLFRFLLSSIVVTSSITIGYRFVAEVKYIPVLLGKETKNDFLETNLNFSYGDFYDIDDSIKYHTNSSGKVLLYGFHNLYYIDFPFIDSSWVKPGDKFTYVAVQNGTTPERFKNWQLIYSNDKTMVKLYKSKTAKENIY